MADWEHFRTETETLVTTVTIDRPPLNTLGVSTLEEMGRILDDLEEDEGTRIVLLTGSGDRFFSAGADIAEFGQLEGGPREAIRRGQALFNRIEHFPKPVIAVLNGDALGGGNELQMACHLAVASDRVRLGLPEVRLGLVPGYGGTQRLPRLIGKRRALYAMLTGEKLTAAEAREAGLINDVFPHDRLLQGAQDLAGELSRRSAPLAMAGILRAAGRGLDLPLEKGLSLEGEEMMKAAATADAAEGIQAFFTKRDPEFKGR